MLPLTCTQCNRDIGPLYPIDADCAGWMCDECYAKLAAPIPAGETASEELPDTTFRAWVQGQMENDNARAAWLHAQPVPEPVSTEGVIELGFCADYPDVPHRKVICSDPETWRPMLTAPIAPAAVSETILLGFKPSRVVNRAAGIIGFRSADDTGNTLELFLRSKPSAEGDGWIAELEAERDRWKEDSLRQAATIKRMGEAAEDRNEVDRLRAISTNEIEAALSDKLRAVSEELDENKSYSGHTLFARIRAIVEGK